MTLYSYIHVKKILLCYEWLVHISYFNVYTCTKEGELGGYKFYLSMFNSFQTSPFMNVAQYWPRGVSIVTSCVTL